MLNKEDKKMELEEAINRLKRVNGLGYENHEAIETVLQALELYQLKEQALKSRKICPLCKIDINSNNIVCGQYEGTSDFIPKKKIEEIKENIPYLSKFNDWKNEEYTNKDVIDNIIEVLQELLNEYKKEI